MDDLILVSCANCGGSGFISENGKITECPDCRGIGQWMSAPPEKEDD